MSAGVNQISLFDAEGEILSERLFFVPPPERRYDFNVSGSKTAYAPREQVKFSFELSGLSGEPLETTFSLSVCDGDVRESTYYKDNIQSDLLLTSDLKGFVEDAASYIADTTGTGRRRMDLLMLVQGWRRYNWREMTGVDKFQLEHNPESTLVIDGYVMNSNRTVKGTGKHYFDKYIYRRVQGADVSIRLQADTLSVNGSVKTDRDGKFCFLLEDELYGTHPLTIRAREKGELKDGYYPVIDRAISPDIEPYGYYETRLPFEDYSEQRGEYAGIPMTGYELDEATITAKKIKRDVIYYEFPDLIVDVEEDVDMVLDKGSPEYQFLFGEIPVYATERHRLGGAIDGFIDKGNGKRIFNFLKFGMYGSSNATSTRIHFSFERIQTMKLYTNQLMRNMFAELDTEKSKLIFEFQNTKATATCGCTSAEWTKQSVLKVTGTVTN